MIDDLMASGRFAERADVLRHAVRLAYADCHDDQPLAPTMLARLEARIAEADADSAGGISAEEVFAEMEQLCLEDIEHRRDAA